MVRIRKGGVGGGGWRGGGGGRGRGRKGGGLRHPPVSFLAKPLPAPPSPPPHATVTTIFPNGRVFISHIYILYASLLHTVLLSTHTHTHTLTALGVPSFICSTWRAARSAASLIITFLSLTQPITAGISTACVSGSDTAVGHVLANRFTARMAARLESFDPPLSTVANSGSSFFMRSPSAVAPASCDMTAPWQRRPPTTSTAVARMGARSSSSRRCTCEEEERRGE